VENWQQFLLQIGIQEDQLLQSWAERFPGIQISEKVCHADQQFFE
jgi:hypothetical protein